MNQVPFVVMTGMHRSGTTFMGRVLSHYRDYHVIHEPLNKEFGLAGVKHVYPCDIIADQERYYLELIDNLLEHKADFVRFADKDGLLKGVARRLVGGRTGYESLVYRLKRSTMSSRLVPVFKDPFMMLLATSLIKRGGKVMIMIRHPAAIWMSIQRMGWKFTYTDFAGPDAFDSLGLHSDVDSLNRLSEVEKFAWLWNSLYTYLMRIEDDDRALLIKHEAFCFEPYAILEEIEAFLGLPVSDKAKDFIYQKMFSGKITPGESRQHVFSRDAKELATSWFNKISADDEKVIQAICGPLVTHYYGQWYPNEM